MMMMTKKNKKNEQIYSALINKRRIETGHNGK